MENTRNKLEKFSDAIHESLITSNLTLVEALGVLKVVKHVLLKKRDEEAEHEKTD